MDKIFQLGTFLVSIITFVIMFLIIRAYGFKPMAKMLEQRRKHIETQINEAEQGRTQAEKLLAEQRQLLDQARNDAKNLLDAARVRAEEQANQILADAKVEAGRLLEEGRKLIERERTEAVNAVLSQVANLSVDLTSKLLKGHVTPAVHEDMLKEAEQELGELVC